VLGVIDLVALLAVYGRGDLISPPWTPVSGRAARNFGYWPLELDDNADAIDGWNPKPTATRILSIMIITRRGEGKAEMTTFFEEQPTVTVDEVAAHLGIKPADVEREALTLQLSVGEDWAGRLAMPVDDARALADGSAARAADNSEANWRYQTAVQQWQADREKIRRAAYVDAFNDARRRHYGNSIAVEAAQQSAAKAVARFEAANPEPTFEQARPRLSWLGRRRKPAKTAAAPAAYVVEAHGEPVTIDDELPAG
jgi:hypothetical protein